MTVPSQVLTVFKDEDSTAFLGNLLQYSEYYPQSKNIDKDLNTLQNNSITSEGCMCALSVFLLYIHLLLYLCTELSVEF